MRERNPSLETAFLAQQTLSALKKGKRWEKVPLGLKFWGLLNRFGGVGESNDGILSEHLYPGFALLKTLAASADRDRVSAADDKREKAFLHEMTNLLVMSDGYEFEDKRKSLAKCLIKAQRFCRRMTWRLGSPDGISFRLRRSTTMARSFFP